MAMNKKEASELQAAKQAASQATALGWPQFPKPVPMAKASRYDELISGWGMNVYSRQVYRVWQSSTTTYFSADRNNGSRSLEPVYATEAEAWQAMLHELAQQFAKVMADVRAKAFPEAVQ